MRLVGSDQGYAEIKDGANVTPTKGGMVRQESDGTPAFLENHGGMRTSSYFDQNLSCFVGVKDLLVKFSSKNTYEPKFIWLDSQFRTIHMSEHPTKDRRHKEASLDDVTSVVAGPPHKAQPSNERAADLCLTVTFKKGGGVDLKFPTKEMRDEWYTNLSKIWKLGQEDS